MVKKTFIYLFKIPYLDRKQRNPYMVTLLFVHPSVKTFFSRLILYQILKSTVPEICEKIKLLSQRNQKVQPLMPQFFEIRKGIITYRVLPVPKSMKFCTIPYKIREKNHYKLIFVVHCIQNECICPRTIQF